MARIALAGFMHETNTFAPLLAPYEEFERHDGYPPLSLGDDYLTQLTGLNLPSGGFIEAALADQQTLLPILWCSAEPSSYVTESAYERIAEMICAGIREAGDLDAVYLDLHGAMVTEHFEDGEGELLRRVRAIVGDGVPIAVSLDLHANVTNAMVALADVITIFRTYPHIDMAATGTRAYTLLRRLLRGDSLYCAFKRVPYLIPLPAQCTDFGPAQTLYSRLESASVASADIAAGFPPADIYECGPSVIAYDTTQSLADQYAESLLEDFAALEGAFDTSLMAPVDAISRATRNNGPGPTVLADAQDNSGAGATSDTTGVLRTLVDSRASGAVIAALFDPGAAARAHAAGVGAEFECDLGGHFDVADQPPFRATYRVEHLASGRFTGMDPMLLDASVDVGPTATLAVVAPGVDVRIVVTSQRFQCLDRSLLFHVGIDPASVRIMVVKSTVHFRSAFDLIAEETLVVNSPGSNPCRHLDLDYQRLRPGVRLEPGGPPHAVQL